jgi:hypothetical protein
MIERMRVQLPPARPSWTATSRPGRALLALTAVLTLLAVLLVAQGLRRQPQHRLLLVAAPAAPTVDPAGCPIGARCRAGATAPPAMLAALQRAFPDSRPRVLTGVSDASTGRPFRVVVDLQLSHATDLTLIAQRLPGEPANDPDRIEYLTYAHDDLGGNQIVDHTTQRLVVGGRPGCSISIELNSPGQDDRFTATVAVMAHDPALQLTP